MHLCRLLIAALLSAVAALSSAAADLQSHIRRPVALALSEDGRWLYTANRDSGSVSMVDTVTRVVAGEIEVGGRLSDLATVDGTHLLAVDEQNHQLVLLSGGDVQWKVAARLDVPEYPVRLNVARDLRRCFVSSLWSRAVTVVDLSQVKGGPESRLRIVKELRLAFEPREMCLAPEGRRLIVAGSFGSTLAVVDVDRMEVIATKDLSGHNIRGLAVGSDGERLLVAQQELNSLARSTQDDVHWGNMLSNLLVSLSLEDVCDPRADVLERRVVHYLGEPGNAAGDPGPIRVGSSGKLAVLLSGVNAVAWGQEEDEYGFGRISVGRRPVAITATTDGTLYVANMYSDSVSVIDPSETRQAVQIALGPQPELTPAQLGEMLFFDGRLSHDGWMSCHSCHTDGHANGQLNDNLSDGSFGAPKRVLSLMGVSETGPWAWNGSVATLEEQVSNSIQKTMQGEEPTDEQVDALVAYLNTLPAPPTRPQQADGARTQEIDRGRELFHALACQRCHAPPIYTTAQAYDVGLTDAVGNRRFNPPSLRGAWRRTALFHDASAKSLSDVLLNRRHQVDRQLSPAELNALRQFLEAI